MIHSEDVVEKVTHLGYHNKHIKATAANEIAMVYPNSLIDSAEI